MVSQLAFRRNLYHYNVDLEVPHNKGLEGVTYDRANRTFYVVREKNEMAVYSFQRGGVNAPAAAHGAVAFEALRTNATVGLYKLNPVDP
jgi:uncharacterized protein YjiK